MRNCDNAYQLTTCQFNFNSLSSSTHKIYLVYTTKLLIFAALFFLFFLSNFAFAQSSGNVSRLDADNSQYQLRKDEANSGTIGIITYFAGTYARFGADLANVLNDHNGVRVLSIMGHGSKQNIEDVLYLKGVDAGLVMGDVLHYIADENKEVNLRKSFVYISRLYPEEIHLLVRKNINSIHELEGKKVSFGPSNSGTRVTSVTTFNRLKINVQELNFDEDQGIRELADGNISGMIFSDGKPSGVISGIDPNSGIKLINIPYETSLQDIYLPATFTYDDYPNLIPNGDTVDTTAVPTVMVAYNWREGSDRYNKLKNFTEAFYNNFDKFLQPERHPKWKEVSLLANLPGWTRFKPAQDMIETLKNQSHRSAQTGSGDQVIREDDEVISEKEMFKRLLARFEERAGGKKLSTAGDTDTLFREFSVWLKQQGRQQ